MASAVSMEQGAMRPQPYRYGLGKTVGWYLGGIVVAAAIIFLRQPRQARNVLWAEDGGIFLNQALQDGGIGVLAPYEGYLHLVPRMAAAVTVAFTDPADYALVMNVLSCFAVAGTAAIIFHCSSVFTDQVQVRLAFASLVPFIGTGPLETTGNFANLHWYLLFLTPFLLLKSSHSRGSACLLFLAGAAVSLTEILSAVFLPLALYRFRDRNMWAARLGLVGGLAAQLVTTLSSPRTTNTLDPMSSPSILLGWFVNGSGTLVFGSDARLGFVVANFGLTPLILASIPFVVALAFVLWKGSRPQRLMAISSFIGSGVIWAAIQVVNPAPFFAYAEFADDAWRTIYPSRYAVIVSMLVLVILPLVMAALPRTAARARAVVLALLIGLQVVAFFPADTTRGDGPDWGAGIEQAAQECASRDPDDRVDVPIAPAGWFADRVSIRCRSL